MTNSYDVKDRFGKNTKHSQDPTVSADSHYLKFRASSADFFAGLGLLLFYFSIAATLKNSGLLMGLVLAIGFLIISEFVIVKRRMLVSGCFALVVFHQGFSSVLITLFAQPGYDLNMLKYVPDGIMGLISPYGGIAMISITALAMYAYWRYSKFPLAFAITLVTLMELPYWVLRIFVPQLDAVGLDMIMFGGAIFMLFVGLWWDMTDVHRKSAKSDIAWWCHLFASVFIVNILAYWILGLHMSDRPQYDEFARFMIAMSAHQANLVFVVAGAAFLVSLVIDRRHYLVCSLVYLLVALATAFGEDSNFPAQAGLVLSIAMLASIVFWSAMRHQMLKFIPTTVRAQLLRQQEN